MPWFKFALICTLIVSLSACSQTPYISTSTHGSDHAREVMYQCAAMTRTNADYTRCLMLNKVVI